MQTQTEQKKPKILLVPPLQLSPPTETCSCPNPKLSTNFSGQTVCTACLKVTQ